MSSRVSWEVGDEVLCKKCGEWHATYIADPGELRYAMNLSLHFACPQSTYGHFYAGRIGEPVFEPDRWRREPPLDLDGLNSTKLE